MKLNLTINFYKLWTNGVVLRQNQ